MTFRERAKEAALCWAITLAPLLIVGGLQWAFAGALANRSFGLEGNASFDSWEFTQFRSDVLRIQLIVAAILLMHWLLVLWFGNGAMRRDRGANACLIVAGSLFLALLGTLGLVNLLDVLKQACPFFGVEPDPLFGFGQGGACTSFAQWIGFVGTIVLPVVLVVCSLALRIWMGRRRQAL